jgi:hypothetical protein
MSSPISTEATAAARPPKPPVTSATGVAAHAAKMQKQDMTRLVLGLVKPYHGWLLIVFAAMIVEIMMSLAAPWPLKLVLDDALGNHHLPAWLEWAHQLGIGRHTLGVALFAGIATLMIAVIGGVATYTTTTTPPASASGSRTTCGCASTSTCTGCRWRSTTAPRPAP